MTPGEAKQAAWDECPVRYKGMFYKRITALIYRKIPTAAGLCRWSLRMARRSEA